MYRKVHLFTVKNREEAQMVANTINEPLVGLHSIQIKSDHYHLLNSLEQAILERNQLHLAFRLPHFLGCEIVEPAERADYTTTWADLSEITHVNIFRFSRPHENEAGYPMRMMFMATSSWLVKEGVVTRLRGPNHLATGEATWNKEYFESMHDTRPARLRWRLENFEQMPFEDFLGIDDPEVTQVERKNCGRRLYVCDEAGAEALSTVAMYPVRSILDHPRMRKGWAELPEDRDISFAEFVDLLVATLKETFTGEPHCWYIPVVFSQGSSYMQLDGRWVGGDAFIHHAIRYTDMCAFVQGISFTLQRTKLLGCGAIFRIDRKDEYRRSKPTINYKKRGDVARGGFRVTPAQMGIRFADPVEIIERGLNDRSGLVMSDNSSLRALSRFGEYCEHLGVNAVMNVDACYRLDPAERLMICAELALDVKTNTEWEHSFTYAVMLPDYAFKPADGSFVVDTTQLEDRGSGPVIGYDPADPFEGV